MMDWNEGRSAMGAVEASRLRDAEPVHKSSFGIWLLSQDEDVAAVLRSQLSVDLRRVKSRHLIKEYKRGDRGARVPSMLDRDPPDHTRLRSLVTKVFTPRAIAALEPVIIGLVDAALDQIAEAGHGDVVEALAFPLPFEVISRMLGVPPTDTARVRELSGTMVRNPDQLALRTHPELSANAVEELLRYVSPAQHSRRITV
jgi:cytochrome P450